MRFGQMLDELPDAELIEELAQRVACRLLGICDYCANSATPTCRFPDRHLLAANKDPGELLRKAFPGCENSLYSKHFFNE